MADVLTIGWEGNVSVSLIIGECRSGRGLKHYDSNKEFTTLSIISLSQKCQLSQRWLLKSAKISST